MKAILWRELKVTFGSAFGLAAQFVAPVFLLVFFATAFSNNIGKIAIGDDQVSYLEFFAPGLFGYVTFLLLALSLAFVRIDKRSGMLAIIALSRTSLSGYFWGKFITQVLLVTLKIVFLIVLAVLLTGRAPAFSLSNLPLFLLTLVLSVAVWYSLGLVGGIFLQRDDIREVVMILVTLPLTFASSMYYNVQIAPEPIRWIATVNPLTYTCNIFRGCFLDTLPSNVIFQLLILATFALVLVTIAWLSLQKIRF
jgi:ABC-2 type transport system permease protein